MPQALSSFLVSVSAIVTIAMVVPCIESVVKLVQRYNGETSSKARAESAKVFSREIA